MVNIVDTGLPTSLCSTGLYIKKVRKRNPGGQRQYEYLHLVENVRTEQGPRQRLVLNLGTLPVEADQYKELANTIEGMLTGQAELFSSDPLIEKQARKAVRRLLERRAHREEKANRRTPRAPEYQTVDMHSLEAPEPRSIGPEYVVDKPIARLDAVGIGGAELGALTGLEFRSYPRQQRFMVTFFDANEVT